MYVLSSLKGSKFMDTWHHRPEQILPIGDLVIVATKGPALYIFDAKTATLQRKFDVTPITSMLGKMCVCICVHALEHTTTLNPQTHPKDHLLVR